MSNTGKKQRGKPVKKINYNMKKKLVILFSLVLLALVALTLRITYINAPAEASIKSRFSARPSRNMKARRCLPSEEIFMIRTEIFSQPAIRFTM